VRKTRTINELLGGGSDRLAELKRRTVQRFEVLAHVRAALPPRLAAMVASAGIDAGQLTIGVMGAAWASRLRYVTETLRKRVGESMGCAIHSVRLKVVPPPAVPPPAPEP
jgi:hypothetical protein